MYPKYCWQHSQKVHPFKIKDSTIPNAGKGLFSVKPIKKDAAIHRTAGYYGGKVVSKQAYQASNSTFGVQLSGDNDILDGASTQSSLLRRANTKKHGQGGNNAKLTLIPKRGQVAERVGAKATKPIAAGSEVFVRYGAGYWNKKHGKKNGVKNG